MHFSLESVFGFTVPFVFFPTTKTLKPFNTRTLEQRCLQIKRGAHALCLSPLTGQAQARG